MITRHFLDIGTRRVHYRRAGSGPALLLVHQSPRSSIEYLPLIERWSKDFTCIAPDSPGFGHSDPLPHDCPTVEDFADATVAFVAALGLDRVAAYGFHSGAIILVNAVRRHPQHFTALGASGYAVWSDAERALFGARYLVPFVPSPYGEHLAWLWGRVVEQSWFFPWFDPRDDNRLPGAHADPVRYDATVHDMLAAGDHYRGGYAAVMAAHNDIPTPDAVVPPALLAAYTGDPLQAHVDRFGPLPLGWSAAKLPNEAAVEAAMLALFRAHPAPVPGAPAEAADAGFIHVATGDYDGLIHWRGSGAVLHIHPPGGAVETRPGGELAIDLPGHGLSDPWPGDPPQDRAAWDAVIAAAAGQLGVASVVHDPAPAGDPARLFPDLSPDECGAYLLRAWRIVRQRAMFDPWYATDAAHARGFVAADLDPQALAAAHRALLRGTAARAYLTARRGPR